jgi:hypothetical protein
LLELGQVLADLGEPLRVEQGTELRGDDVELDSSGACHQAHEILEVFAGGADGSGGGGHVRCPPVLAKAEARDRPADLGAGRSQRRIEVPSQMGFEGGGCNPCEVAG